MTIKEVLTRARNDSAAMPEERRERYVEHTMELLEVWSNTSAIGYVIAAAQQIGMTFYDIDQLVKAVEKELEYVSVDEAHRIYCDFSENYPYPDLSD